MANTVLTIDMITRKALTVLENNLTLTRNINRQYDSSFAQTGAKIGSTLRVRKPARFLVQDGAALAAEDYLEEYTTLSITSQKHVDVSFGSAEMTLNMDDFSERFLEPAMSQLAAYIDNDLHNVYKAVANSVGTPGTTPATSLVLGQAMQKLDETATSRSMRYGVFNPAANTGLVEGLKGLFNPGSTISNQFKTGLMGSGVLGYDEISMSQSVKSHTTGDFGTGITITNTVAVQGAAAVDLSFTGSSKTWNVGDVFTIQNVYAVNPQTRESTGSLQQFTVTEAKTGSSTVTGLAISPALYTSAHKLATVNSFPVATATVTMVGTAATLYPQNLVHHKNAFTLATADLEMPDVGKASRQVYKGISMRVWKASDINSDRHPCRIDVLYGYKCLRPEMACRVWG